jgi:F-type H+-transporting ATPase subunit b
MESLIETFYIDWRLLIAQAVNFAIVFFVLYFFALKPLVKVMNERTRKIEKSLTDAKKVEENLARSEEEYKRKLAEAKKEANKIIEKAKDQAEEKKIQIITKAKEEVGKIINEEKVKIQREKAEVLKEIKREVADLVIMSVEKVLGKKIEKKEDKELIRRMVK